MRPRSPPQLTRLPPAIASLQDALAYPQQPALLGPLKPPPRQKNKKKSRQRQSAPRKQFPRPLARFRDRLQYLEERLRLDVNSLRQDVRDLELHRSLLEQRALSTRHSPGGAAAQLVREYFVVFARGFQRAPEGDSLDLRAMRMLHTLNSRSGGGASGDTAQRLLPPSLHALQTQIETANRQQAFLEALVDPQLTFQRFVGRDVLVEQWQRYSQCHAGLSMHMNTLEVVPVSEAQQRQLRRQSRQHRSFLGDDDDDDDDDDGQDATVAVHATGRLTAYVTQDTLEQIFPHVLRNPGLAQRLIGAFIEYPFRVEFHVRGDGRMTKYDADVDFVTALSGVLGNFEDVTLLMRDALISEYCMIGRLDAESTEEIHASHCEVIAEDEEMSMDEEMPMDETREPSRVGGDRRWAVGEGAETQRDAADDTAGVSKAAIQFVLS